MSAPGPESIPVSADPRSKRPVKKRALTPVSQQASHLDSLFARPDQDIRIPTGPPDPRRKLPLPPEIVTNVQGSSAGAGSGEFHVYKAARRREYERLRIMDEEVRRDEAQRDFEEKKKELEEDDRKKTERNRAKREKMRARKEKAKAGKKDEAKQQPDGAAAPGGGGVKARVVQARNGHGDGEAAGSGTMDVDKEDARTGQVAAPETTTLGLLIHDDD